MKSRTRMLLLIAALCFCGTLSAQEQETRSSAKHIRQLSQHFADANETSPWMFYPQSNIKSLSTRERPGLVTIWEAGKGEDIKGILKDPIEFSDYPLPWEFQLQLAQNQQVFKAATTDKERQLNYAIGLNLAVTFSDPSTWPKDRTQMPPETHSVQLFVTHLGSYGEMYRTGLPQIRNSALNYNDPSPETYLVYGRGDLSANVNGNWKVPFIWNGYQPPAPGQLGSAAGWSWVADQGPASMYVRFRVRMVSATQLEIGFGYGLGVGWRMRTIDVSRFGKITGIWQIGPVISLDRWIPDVLAAELGIQPPPAVQVPGPTYEYFVDYAVFYGNGPQNLEDLSEDFDVPGYEGTDQKWFQEGNAITQTFTHPGYLTVSLMGTNAVWGMAPMLAAEMPGGLGYVDLDRFKPPWEIETSFVSPDDRQPWNFSMLFTLFDGKGVGHDWTPGLQNFPESGVKFVNYFRDPNNSKGLYDEWYYSAFNVEHGKNINVEFVKEVPQSVLAHKPLFMLVQVVDTSHVRVGFKANKTDPWQFSKPFDISNQFGKVAKIQLPEFVSVQGKQWQKGWGAGNYPGFQQFLIDYVHIRYGLSSSN